MRAYAASAWTEEDRALMLARNVYLLDPLPGGCGYPKATAWHPDNEGWFEGDATYECHACTALRSGRATPTTPPVVFIAVTDTRDYENNPLPPMPTGPRLDPDELRDVIGGAV